MSISCLKSKIKGFIKVGIRKKWQGEIYFGFLEGIACPLVVYPLPCLFASKEV